MVKGPNRSVRALLWLATGLLVASPGLGQSQVPGVQADDETAIKANVKQIEQGWHTKQATLFATPFAEDADYVAINGLQGKGRRIIEEAHDRIFRTIYRDSTIQLHVKQIRMLRPDVALVHVAGHNRTRRDGEAQEWEMVLSMVMSREADGWKIVSFQNTRVETPRP